MSGEKKGLQQRICHVSPYALYMNCWNHHLALCLVHLLKQHNEFKSVDALLLSIWKIFHYSLIKQAVFENAQETKNMMLLKILKSCTTQWLMHSETSIRIITQFKPLVAALDAIYKDKKDLEAKGICNILLTPDIILMLLLLAEVLVPIKNFCKFLQTRNLNYSLAMTKYQQVLSKLEPIKTELPNHSSININLKCFKFTSEYLQYSQEVMSLARELQSRDTEFASINGKINQFIGSMGMQMITGLIAEITDTMEETSPVLLAFDLFNPDAIFKDNDTLAMHS